MAIEPTPTYTNDGTATFVPALWNSALLEELDPQLVFASAIVANRNYEGNISGQGDTVHINGIAAPEVGPYSDTEGMTIQQLSTIKQSLKITQADYVAYYVGDIENVQAAGALQAPAMRRSTQHLARSVDTFVGGVIAKSATKLADIDVTKATKPTEKGEAILEGLFDMMEQLDSADVPEGRYAVVSPKVKRFLLRTPDVANAAAFGEGGATKNGVIARLGGFTILTTTHMPTGVDIVAGHQMFTTYANQFQGFREQPVEKFRRNQIDGLNVYGAKVVRFPELDELAADKKSFDETKPSKGLIKATVKFA